MKKGTDISIILDRSGSMGSIKEATIESFNAFLQEQQKSEHETILSLVQFDNEYETLIESTDIKLVNYLNDDTYVPRGSTALYDAIGITIASTKKRIKNSKSKPENALLVIITDGFENASTKYSSSDIFKMIRKRESKDHWKFIYLAANQDAVLEGGKIGIHAKRSMTFSQDKQGISNALYSLSDNIECLKSCSTSDFSFKEADRAKQARERRK